MTQGVLKDDRSSIIQTLAALTSHASHEKESESKARYIPHTLHDYTIVVVPRCMEVMSRAELLDTAASTIGIVARRRQHPGEGRRQLNISSRRDGN